MAEIINLNKARKAKTRVDKAAQAEVNRTRFGRTKAQKQADAADDVNEDAGRVNGGHPMSCASRHT